MCAARDTEEAQIAIVAQLRDAWETMLRFDPQAAILSWESNRSIKPLKAPIPDQVSQISRRHTPFIQPKWQNSATFTPIRFLLGHNVEINKILEEDKLKELVRDYDGSLAVDHIQDMHKVTVGQLVGSLPSDSTLQIIKDVLRRCRNFVVNNVSEFELGIGMHRTHKGKFDARDVKTRVVTVYASLKQKISVAAAMRDKYSSTPRCDYPLGIQM